MLRKLRKSSGRVTLVLIGVAALSACSGERKRDVYRSREDCLADWANKPEDCTPATQPRHAGSGFFYGPWYASRGFFGNSAWSRDATSNRSVSSVGHASSITRGGFGASARSSAG